MSSSPYNTYSQKYKPSVSKIQQMANVIHHIIDDAQLRSPIDGGICDGLVIALNSSPRHWWGSHTKWSMPDKHKAETPNTPAHHPIPTITEYLSQLQHTVRDEMMIKPITDISEETFMQKAPKAQKQDDPNHDLNRLVGMKEQGLHEVVTEKTVESKTHKKAKKPSPSSTIINNNSGYFLQIRQGARKSEIELCKVSCDRFMLKEVRSHSNLFKRCESVEDSYKLRGEA